MKENINRVEEKIANQLKKVVKYKKDIISVIDTLKNDIVPRFESFSNFDSCSVGLDRHYNTAFIRVCFDIKSKKRDNS